MRKGLIAIVVLAALGALAVMFWPREVERDPEAPGAGDAVRAPVGSEAERTEEARQASRFAVAPMSENVEDTPPPPAAGASGDGKSGPTTSLAPENPTADLSAAGEAVAAAEAGLSGGAGERRPVQPQPAAEGDAAPSPAGEETADSGRPPPPSFDLVRVSPDGQAVIAGRAAPGETVDILLDGELVASAEADASGAFVALAEATPGSEPRELVLRVERPRGAADRSGQPDARGERLASLDGAAGAAAGDHLFSAPVIVLPSADAAEAPVLVRPGEEELELVQPAMAEVNRMALDRISYEAGGDVIAAGRGPDASAVRAYANGELVAEAPVGEDGAWRAVIPHQVAQGTDLLRFDEVSAEGEVLTRLEAPFQYASEGADQALERREITIDRGASLWRIAEQHYGEGLRYSVIYSANAELIRDPDLIYPGQVLSVPKLVETD